MPELKLAVLLRNARLIKGLCQIQDSRGGHGWKTVSSFALGNKAEIGILNEELSGSCQIHRILMCQNADSPWLSTPFRLPPHVPACSYHLLQNTVVLAGRLDWILKES